MKNYLLLFVFLITNFAFSQSINIGAKKTIFSNTLNEEREYYIHLPERYNDKNSYPVLYVLDGDEYFWLAASTVRYFSNRGFMPETIVVGINNRQNRDRDFTPTKDNYSPTGGGAENFLAFLTKELIPTIEKEYKTKSHKTLYGASYGGLFALYTLFNHPDSFDNYIAISPSIFHDKGLVFNHAIEYFNKANHTGKYVFLSLADESWTEMRLSFGNMITLFKSKALKANIRWDYRYYNDETHESTKLVGLNDGLRKLHQSWFVPFYQRDRGIVGLKDHYSMLNEQYGYPIEIPESLVNRIAYNNLRDGKKESTGSLFKYNVEHFPNSPNAYDSYGEFFERQENYKEAKKYYELAVSVAKKNNQDQTPYIKSLDRINKTIKKEKKD